MELLLIPVSLIIKQITNLFSGSVYYLAEIPVYIYALILSYYLFMRIKRRESFLLRNVFNKRVVFCTVIILTFQLITYIVHYFNFKGTYWEHNPLVDFTKLCVIFFLVIVHYLVVKYSIKDINNVRKFIIGYNIGFAFLMIVCYLQFLFLLFPQIMAPVVHFLGNFEYRYDRDWYTAGSYVQTLFRINGFNPESDYLAEQLFIVFTPFILASLKNRKALFTQNERLGMIINWLLLLSVILILFFAKTTTGIVAILGLILTLWCIASKRWKIIYVIAVPLIIVSVYLIALKSIFVMDVVNNTIIQKMGLKQLGAASMLNRIGSVLGSIITWLHHPIFGVGYGNHDYYLLKYAPSWTKDNFEYSQVYKPQNFYPILSVFFGWLVELGAVFVSIIVIYIVKLLRDIKKLTRLVIVGLNENERKWLSVVSDAAPLFFIYYLFCSFLAMNWYESNYMIMFFFFVCYRHLLKNILKNKNLGV